MNVEQTPRQVARVQKMVRQFLEKQYGTADRKKLHETYGVRIRKQRGGQEGVYEVATTFFYRHQARTASFYREFCRYTESNGFTVRAVRLFGLEPVRGDVANAVVFDSKPWPETSWATLLVQITEVEA